MAHEIKKYRVWCDTDSKYEYVWGTEAPTKCPTNTTHSLTGGATIVGGLSSNDLRLQEEDPLHKTGGHFQVHGEQFEAPNNSVTNHDFSFPFDIAIFAATVNTSGLSDGDTIDFEIGPDTIIGAITADVTANDTVITVQQSVIDNIAVGKYLTLDDGTNSERGWVIDIDDVNLTVTLNAGTTNGYSAATPTTCGVTTKMANNLEIVSSSRYDLGQSKMGGSWVPAGTIIRISFTNGAGSQVRVRAVFELTY